MLKVLIVDDDRLIREDVRYLLDWASLGFQIVGEADNGEEAIKLAISLEVDVILTDMDMPIMDGIELIRSLKSTRPQMKFLVMSNYDHFDYVKDAMKYGASDYVLKYKLDPAILSQLLTQIRHTIQREREEELSRNHIQQFGEQGKQALIERLWHDYLEGIGPVKEAEVEAERLAIETRKNSWLMLLVEVERNAEAAKEQIMQQFEHELHYIVDMNKQQWMVLLPTEERSQLFLKNKLFEHASSLHHAMRKVGQVGKTVIVQGDICIRFQQLPVVYKLLQARLLEAFYDGFDQLLDTTVAKPLSEQADEGIIDKYEQGMMHAIHTGNQEYAMQQLNAMFGHLHQMRCTPAYVRGYLRMLVHQLNKKLKSQTGVFTFVQLDTDACYAQLQARFGTLNELHQVIARLIERYYSAAEPTIIREEIMKVIGYMERNHASEITLLEAAKHVNLSKSHFCALFKQETGENFINYLNRIRIEKAKLLLLESEGRVKDIAGIVGLDNYRYFCRIFKQMTGLRPSDYKQSTSRQSV